MGLGMILDSAVGMFPHKIGPLLQLLTALVSNKSTVKKVDFTHALLYTHQLCFIYVVKLIFLDFAGVQFFG